MIQQAVRDIVSNRKDMIDLKHPTLKHIRAVDQAIWWFEDEDDGLGSYAFCCTLLDINPDRLRNAIQAGDWEKLKQIANIPIH